MAKGKWRVRLISASATTMVLVILLLVVHLSANTDGQTQKTTPFHDETRQALQLIAIREGVPVEQLQLGSAFPLDYTELLDRSFWAVKAINLQSGEIYRVLLDRADGCEADFAELERAAAKAYQAQYGKFDPSLHEWLQTAEPDDETRVVIWVAADLDLEGIWAELAARYPQAGPLSSAPMAVSDPQLSQVIAVDYHRLVSKAVAKQVQPLVEWLESQEFPVGTVDIPLVFATLPKAAIQQIAWRKDVLYINLGEVEAAKLEMDTSAPAVRAPDVWERMGGVPVPDLDVTIGIIEHGMIYTPSNHLNLEAIRPDSEPHGINPDHMTLVASIAASFHPTYTGIAPGAWILSANIAKNTEPLLFMRQISATDWARDEGAEVINMSTGVGESSNIELGDEAFDAWVRLYRLPVLKAAGNMEGANPGHITSPGKGWNVLTVGAFDHYESSDWTDDRMWAESCYLNPIVSDDPDGGDREKPEVVAPGYEIEGPCWENELCSQSGTSFAAPHVSGLTALLIHRDSALNGRPEALKAIIMASAINNIEGPNVMRVDDDIDDRDGAGAIDALTADNVAQNHRDFWADCTAVDAPCHDDFGWMAADITSDTLPSGEELHRYLDVPAAKRVRVAISWYSNVDFRADYPWPDFDRLDTDLDLIIRFVEDDSRVAYSFSWYNNYEIVDFLTETAGVYEIIARKTSVYNDEQENTLAIAWAVVEPDRIYLPIIIRNYSESP